VHAEDGPTWSRERVSPSVKTAIFMNDTLSPTLPRRVCSAVLGTALPSRGGESENITKRRRELISHPESLFVRFATLTSHRCTGRRSTRGRWGGGARTEADAQAHHGGDALVVRHAREQLHDLPGHGLRHVGSKACGLHPSLSRSVAQSPRSTTWHAAAPRERERERERETERPSLPTAR
jgi:hypothetical protein